MQSRFVSSWLVLVGLGAWVCLMSCSNHQEDQVLLDFDHQSDHFPAWTSDGDSLSMLALRWIAAVDQGDTASWAALLADWVEPPSGKRLLALLPKDSLLKQLYFQHRSGYRQRTEVLATLPFGQRDDTLHYVMGYLRQLRRSGSNGPWLGRRLAVLWAFEGNRCVQWTEWEQGWPLEGSADTLVMRDFPRWGLTAYPADAPNRQVVLDWEKRLEQNYVKNAAAYWADPAGARGEDGWSWEGSPSAMASFLALETPHYRDMDSVQRRFHRAECFQLGTEGPVMGLAFGHETRYRRGFVSKHRVHRLYALENQKIVFAEQFSLPVETFDNLIFPDYSW